jgi:predicted DCC family thiol-disulfide oxidoreductase YuxK
VTRVVARLDRDDKLAFLPMRDPAAAPLLESLPDDEHFATWHLVRANGSIVGDGRGGVELLAAMRLTRGSARLLDLVPDAVLDGAYGLVARNRSLLGRLVPDGVAPRRYP